MTEKGVEHAKTIILELPPTDDLLALVKSVSKAIDTLLARIAEDVGVPVAALKSSLATHNLLETGRVMGVEAAELIAAFALAALRSEKKEQKH